jgi:hypothetical protein
LQQCNAGSASRPDTALISGVGWACRTVANVTTVRRKLVGIMNFIVLDLKDGREVSFLDKDETDQAE